MLIKAKTDSGWVKALLALELGPALQERNRDVHRPRVKTVPRKR